MGGVCYIDLLSFLRLRVGGVLQLHWFTVFSESESGWCGLH